MRIVHPNGFELEFQNLASFICDGKRNGWASGDKPTKFTDGSEGYKYVDRKLFYRDSYIGEGNFMGQEVVFLIQGLPDKHIPLWGMNYSDKFTLPHEIPEDEAKQFKTEVFNFLKGQLRNVPLDFPFRGPVGQSETQVMGRKLRYLNAVDTRSDLPTGDYVGGDRAIRDFRGVETIFMEDPKHEKEIFRLDYNGRILVPDSYITK